MTKRVLKYSLELIAGPQKIAMRLGAAIVHVHEQNNRPCLWAEVDLDERIERVDRVFDVFATGEDCEGRHLGTVHIGWTVWHVYEVWP